MVDQREPFDPTKPARAPFAEQQKTRRSGFFQNHPNTLSVAIMAMVDRP